MNGLVSKFVRAPLSGVLLIALSAGPVSASAKALVHPGGWHTQADLTLIRTKVAAGEEPWISGWNAVKDTGADETYTASVSPIMTDKSALSNQGHAAYVLAINGWRPAIRNMPMPPFELLMRG